MGRDMMRLRRGILLNTPHEEQASGAVASFATDIGKLKECVVGIEPVQDLHGYDSPWPPGGGKNLLNLYLERTNNLGVNFSLTQDGKMHLEGTNTSTTSSAFTGGNFSTYEACPWKFSAGTYMFSTTVPSSNAEIGSVVFSIRTKTDNTLRTFNAKSKAVTVTVDDDFGGWFWISVLKEKTVNIDVGLQLEKGSTATSWTPYENICPISGWSEANVYDDPKYDRTVWWNQLAFGNRFVSGTSFGITTSLDSNTGLITLSGTSSSTYRPLWTRSTLVVGHVYLNTLKFVTNPNNISARINFFNDVVTLARITTGDMVCKCTHERDTVTCGLEAFGGAGVNFDGVTLFTNSFDLTQMFGSAIADEIYAMEQNELGSGVAYFRSLFPNDYYAYNAGEETLVSAVNGEPYRAVTIDLDGTRYGGTLDVTQGKMVVTHASADMGGLSYVRTSSADVYVFRNNIGAAPVTDYIQHGLTSIYPFAGTRFISLMPDKSWMIDRSGRFIVRDDSYTDANAFKTAMTGQTLVYDIATPFDVQLTPAQLRAIKGQNNIFADCGDIAVKYWKH